MQNATGWLFYLLFGAVLAVMYLSIRRRWAPPGIVAGAGTLASIIAMVLISLSQGNSILQAIVVGILVGVLFSGATLAIAWYFHSHELRARYPNAAPRPPTPPQVEPAPGDEDY